MPQLVISVTHRTTSTRLRPVRDKASLCVAGTSAERTYPVYPRLPDTTTAATPGLDPAGDSRHPHSRLEAALRHVDVPVRPGFDHETSASEPTWPTERLEVYLKERPADPTAGRTNSPTSSSGC